MGREAWDCLEGRMSRRVKQKCRFVKNCLPKQKKFLITPLESQAINPLIENLLFFFPAFNLLSIFFSFLFAFFFFFDRFVFTFSFESSTRYRFIENFFSNRHYE